MNSDFIKINGKNEEIINGVVNAIVYLLKVEKGINLSRRTVFDKVMEVLKTDGVILQIYYLVVLMLEN